MTSPGTGRPDQGAEPGDECPPSERVDGKLHTWRWDGDDPRIFCHWCGEMRDALTGRVMRDGVR